VDEQRRDIRKNSTRAQRVFGWQAEIKISLGGWLGLGIKETKQPTQTKQTSGGQNGLACKFQEIATGYLRVFIHRVTE
jgi:hypothetical protein